jgi:hypothetical protein
VSGKNSVRRSVATRIVKKISVVTPKSIIFFNLLTLFCFRNLFDRAYPNNTAATLIHIAGKAIDPVYCSVGVCEVKQNP